MRRSSASAILCVDMPSKKAPPKRKLTDEGLRRVASWGKGLGTKSESRHHRWLCEPGEDCNKPMPSELDTFSEDPNWRIFRIMAEFIEGFEFLDKFTGEVSIFGSARTKPSDPYYKQAKELGRLLGEGGYCVITGGGPGIMEAANWGAFEAGGESVGLDIQLPTEQRRNQYVTQSIGFHYFFTRKVMLSAAAQAYVFFPGGFGTLDEMTEMATLVQTGKIPRDVPIILVGKKFWEPFLEWLERVDYMQEKYITEEDYDLLHLVDSPEEAMEIIRKTHERPYGSPRRVLMSEKKRHEKIKRKGKQANDLG
jgi:uncharacterized protein (TIGR00730 family)